MTKTFAYSTSVLLLLGVLTGCGAALEDVTPETTSFPLTGSSLTVTTDNGALEITTADVDGVEVTRWFGGDADQGTWELEGDTLTLGSGCGFLRSCDARYAIVVPRDVALEIEGENSPVTVQDVTRPLTVRTQNGDVTVTGSSGDIELHTDNGAQAVSASNPARLTSRTANGAVTISLDEPPNELTATAGNGRVRVALPDEATYAVQIDTHNGEVENSLKTDPGSPHRIRVTTQNGAVTLGALR